ncbi:hypothetical protein ACI2K4_23985 [Micromonospora sp. NPDC050397]|uniref:hypothetical protein n=1 Tax=Micromonospora sp. NPDC050397 TaxID=3364279 RepID=UPI00384F4DDA
MTTEPRRLTGTGVYRIVWLPGSDRLRGTCWCGTDRDADDPVELWDWLLGHPDQHGDEGSGSGRPAPAGGRSLAGTRS